MTNVQTPTTDVSGDGQQPDQGRTFTQDEMNYQIAQRLTRERAKFADYDALKAAADRLQQLEDAQKSELERAQQAQATAEAAASAAMEQANARLIKAEFIAKAAVLGVAHPEDAYALALAANEKVTVDADGAIAGVEDAVKKLVDAGRLVMTGKPLAPSTDAGAGGGDRTTGTVKLTPEQLVQATKMGVSPEVYAKNIKPDGG